jgi:hypothetical protein
MSATKVICACKKKKKSEIKDSQWNNGIISHDKSVTLLIIPDINPLFVGWICPHLQVEW